MNPPLSVCCWKWGTRFAAAEVNILRSMLDRHLHLEHRLFCITDDPAGLDGDIVPVAMPRAYADTLRCRRRMQQYDPEFTAAAGCGPRVLLIDLDVVLVDDITPIVDRTEPIVGWKVGHAGVYSGSFILSDRGALHGAWLAYRQDPLGYPKQAAPKGIGSDQAMLNHYLAGQPPIAHWTEADGFVTYYGAGYERLEFLGVGPSRPTLPAGARLVVLGSDDLPVLRERRFPWVEEHWR